MRRHVLNYYAHFTVNYKEGTMADTVDKRIVRARVQLLRLFPFFGHLLLYLQPRETAEVGTCGTDGKYLYYNPAALDKWSEQELMAVLAHEVGHCAFGHLWRKGERDMMLWNFATDFKVNQLVEESNLTLPAGCLRDTKYDNLAAEEIYRLLEKQMTKIKGHILDDHSKWGDQEEEKGAGDKGKDAEGSTKEGAARTWRDKAVRAAQVAKQQGNLPGSLEEFIDNLVEPKISWVDLLRDYVQSTTGFQDMRMLPPNKKFLWMPMYLPTLYGETYDIVVGMDTSGSMSHEELAKCYSEIVGICSQLTSYRLHIIQCDAAVHKYNMVENEADIDFEVAGRGGTRFEPVFEYIQELDIIPNCLIYFTDLMGSFPEEPAYPTIWVSTESTGTAPFGIVIHMES
jgi:predicted metal-dependent peptidase